MLADSDSIIQVSSKAGWHSKTMAIHLLENTSTREWYVFELGEEFDDDCFQSFYTLIEAEEYYETL